nr:reverse transcriptase domain-containing protein [Tanacetum cinerariifolium]
NAAKDEDPKCWSACCRITRRRNGLVEVRGVKGVNENVKNVLVNGNRVGSMQDMSGCSIDQKLKYIAGSFVGKALTWWNSQIRMLSREVAVSIWNDFKFMMIEEYCLSHEMQKLKTELWNHAMVGAGHIAYTDKFHELARAHGMIIKIVCAFSWLD